MFTLPPVPPKHYILKKVGGSYTTNQVFTPDDLPRVSLPTVDKFCYPIYSDDITPAEYGIHHPTAKTLELWADRARAEWVDRPNENAKLVYDMTKKFSLEVEEERDPRFKHIPPIFPRSFKYELDCIEVKRREKLKAKAQKELMDIEKEREIRHQKEMAAKPPSIDIVPCDPKPPFWWSSDGVHEESKEPTLRTAQGKTVDSGTASYLRWQQKPGLFGDQGDVCQRMLDMTLVGQPFMNEACGWYYVNYPPPDIPFIPKKFAH